MTGNCSFNENQTEVILTATFKLPIIKNGDELTHAQTEALKAYCRRYLKARVILGLEEKPIVISSCEIYRKENTGEHRYRIFYDADTGELYDEEDICEQIKDGKHEIRLTAPETTNSTVQT